MKNLLFLLLLTGCSPSFHNGGWVAPVILFLASGWFYMNAWQERRDGSGYYDRFNIWVTDKKPVPYYRLGHFWYSIVCLVAAIATMIVMASDK